MTDEAGLAREARVQRVSDWVEGLHVDQSEEWVKDIKETVRLARNALRRSDEWQDMSSFPGDAPAMVGLWVTNNKTGERWWETYIIALEDESGDAISHPDGDPLPWDLDSFERWRPLPAPPSAGE